MEPGHFDKYFNKRKKAPHRKIGSFSPRYSYNYNLNRKINSKMDKIRVFFDFKKRAAEACHLPPLVVRLVLEGAGGNDLQFSQETHFSLESGV